jgi:hypothetical protein
VHRGWQAMALVDALADVGVITFAPQLVSAV